MSSDESAPGGDQPAFLQRFVERAKVLIPLMPYAGTLLLLLGTGAEIRSFALVWSHLEPPPDLAARLGIDVSKLGPEDTNPLIPWQETWLVPHWLLLAVPLCCIVVAGLAILAARGGRRSALRLLAAGFVTLATLLLLLLILEASFGNGGWQIVYDFGSQLYLLGYGGTLVGLWLLLWKSARRRVRQGQVSGAL